MVRQLAREAKVTAANKDPFGFDAADCMAELSGKERLTGPAQSLPTSTYLYS